MKNRDEAFYAHSKDGEPPEKWQPLEEHLKNVAELARICRRFWGGGMGLSGGVVV